MSDQIKVAWIGILGVVLAGIIAGLFTLGNNPAEQTETVTPQPPINIDTLSQNIPIEKYTAELAKKEKEIRQLLVDAALSDRDRSDLEKELAAVEKLRSDEQSSYEAHIKELEERVSRLDQLAGQVPDKLIEDAKQALIKGDKTQAEKLFQQVKEQAASHIKAAAEAEYQLGKLADDDIRYREAYEHFQRATQLTPDNTTYLNQAGLMADTLGDYQKAIGYLELALATFKKMLGENHLRNVFKCDWAACWLLLNGLIK